MEREIFWMDHTNKKVKRLSTAFVRLWLTIFDFCILAFLGMVVTFVVLGEFDQFDIGQNFLFKYIGIVCIYVFFEIIRSGIDLIRYIYMKNTIIVREDNNIIVITLKNQDTEFLLGTIAIRSGNRLRKSNELLGTIFMICGVKKGQKGLLKRDQEKIKSISKIIDERTKEHKYRDYKNCRLLKEHKKYYMLYGENNGRYKKFKIYKVYHKIDESIKEDN